MKPHTKFGRLTKHSIGILLSIVCLVVFFRQFELEKLLHAVDVSASEAVVKICSIAQIYPEDRGTNYAIREGRSIAEKLLNQFSYPPAIESKNGSH